MEKYLKNNRIYVRPSAWVKLHALLEKETEGKVTPPLILSGWNLTEDWEKSMRFKEHLILIKEENITAAMAFLDELTEEEWYNKGE